jgi:hypothetical protein
MRHRFVVAAVVVLSACGGLTLKPDESLAPASVTVTRVERVIKNASGRTVSAYLVFDKPFAGLLEMRLYDRDDEKGVEVGRTLVAVNEPAGARYIDFTFDPRTPVHAAGAVRVKAVSATPANDTSDAGPAVSADAGAADLADAGVPAAADGGVDGTESPTAPDAGVVDAGAG